MQTEKQQPEILKQVSIRQHAAVVGLLAERHVLITSRSLYIVQGEPSPVADILQIDSGLLWIALMERIGGDSATAEYALRSAIARYATLVGTDMQARGSDSIDLSVARVVLMNRKQDPNDWFMDFLSTAFRFLHPRTPVTPAGIGSIWQDAWRLYAGALSVLGDVTSRRVPGDSDDYL